MDEKRLGILICGGNGCGKTTLGHALSQKLKISHFDIEDYYFEPSALPFSKPRTREEVEVLLLSDIEKSGSFILSSVNGHFCDEITSKYTLIVYLYAPIDTRMQRVRQRALDKYGTRVLEGGDMYESEKKFFDFVRKRSLDKIEEWVNTFPCSLLRLDAENSIEKNTSIIIQYIAQRQPQ